MKSSFLIFFIIATSAYAKEYSFIGSLLDSENNLVSDCIVRSELDTFSQKKIKLSNIKYLGKNIKNIDLRMYIINGVGGNLFLGRSDNTRVVFNTDSIFKILEVSIFDDTDNYKCTHFYEK